jgi:hypothetical protein
MDVKTPYISPELIAYLDLLFPNELPDGTIESVHEVNALVGQRRVVDHLKSLLETQENKDYHV